MKFMKKPVIVEAIHWNETVATLEKLRQIGFGHVCMGYTSYVEDHAWHGRIRGLRIRVGNGDPTYIQHGDWIIKEAEGRFSACSPEVFTHEYMRVAEPKRE